jgi:hypothetical protein
MGATNFVTGAIRTASIRDAYDAAVNDAVAEHGHDSYNGTISTTGGYHQSVATPMTVSGANLIASTAWDHAEKWGPAEAVPVAEDRHFTFRKIKSVIELPTTDEHGSMTSAHDLREAAVAKAVTQHSGSLHSVEVTPKVKTKIVTETAKGRAVTKYEVSSGRSSRFFDTKAQATAAAKRLVSDDTWYRSVTVRAVKVYEDSGSADAVVVKRVTVEAKAAVTVTIATPKKPGSTPVEGWIFYGIAAI